jgi:hypothetical protein
MKSCSLCSTELKFLNTPGFGAGKLADGGQLCSKCYMKVPNSISTKKLSLAELQAVLQQKEADSADKKVKEAEKKIAKEEEKKVKEEEKNIKAEEKKTAKDEEKKIKEEQKKANALVEMQEKAAEEEQQKAKLEEVKTTIKNLKIDGISGFLGKKEINELPKILAANETLDHMIQGFYNNGNGILVSTDRRLIFIDKGLLYGVKVEDFPLDKISSIQYETGLLLGKVKIHSTSNVATIENVDKSAARKFSEFVRDKLSRPKEQAAPVIVQAAAQPSVIEQIEKLAQLKEKGILSDDEFAEQKKKLLEKL